MTGFEKYLTKHGYNKYVLNSKTGVLEEAKGHELSTLGNLEHRYVFAFDNEVMDKIFDGVPYSDFTDEERGRIISFGLHEHGKPPTLIYPLPNIRVIRDDAVHGRVVYNETSNDSVNAVLDLFPHNHILWSLFDRSRCFQLDLTNGGVKPYFIKSFANDSRVEVEYNELLEPVAAKFYQKADRNYEGEGDALMMEIKTVTDSDGKYHVIETGRFCFSHAYHLTCMLKYFKKLKKVEK